MDVNTDSIDVDDIAKNIKNKIILRRLQLQRNECWAGENTKSLCINNHYDTRHDYRPEGADDMRWLGYFVSKNEHLQKLQIRHFVPTSGASARDVLDSFFRGVNCNKSIREISFTSMDLWGGEMLTMLTPFFRDNHNLTNIMVINCDLGHDGSRLLSLALGECRHKPLQQVKLERNDISDEGMVDIITALSMHPHLQRLDLDGNHLRKNGCVALATLLQNTKLS